MVKVGGVRASHTSGALVRTSVVRTGADTKVETILIVIIRGIGIEIKIVVRIVEGVFIPFHRRAVGNVSNSKPRESVGSKNEAESGGEEVEDTPGKRGDGREESHPKRSKGGDVSERRGEEIYNRG